MEGEIMELYELRYSDLMLLSSDKAAESIQEIQRMESVARMVMETLGPKGPGLLAITGVPRTSSLRRSLLPLSRKLALLNNEDRKKLHKEHDLGSDVPLKNLDRIVSSFAKKLKYDERFESNSCKTNQLVVGKGEAFLEVGFENLGYIFNELGYCMMEVGLRLAQICDEFIGGHELQQSLLQSGTAKGRLVHYHSSIDNRIIKEAANTSVKAGTRNKSQIKRREETRELSDSMLWQQWHYDYGVFTVLTEPMFILSSNDEAPTEERNNSCMPCEQESPSPCGHTFLQILDPHKDGIFMVKAPPESLIAQVGEAADVLSKGKLRATLHSVCRPPKPKNLSREMFAVFLQPAWSKIFSLSDYPLKQLHSDEPKVERESEKLSQKIRSIVPSLSSRLKDGMTFADFSRETTNQYYGSDGLQSNR